MLKRSLRKQSDISRALKAVLESNSTDAMARLQIALQRQRLILPIKNDLQNVARDGNGRLLDGIQLEFLGFKDANGQKFLAVFTNPQELGKWNPSLTNWIAVDTPSICGIARSSGYEQLKINPGSRPCVQLGKGAIEALRTLPKRIGCPIRDAIAFRGSVHLNSRVDFRIALRYACGFVVPQWSAPSVPSCFCDGAVTQRFFWTNQFLGEF